MQNKEAIECRNKPHPHISILDRNKVKLDEYKAILDKHKVKPRRFLESLVQYLENRAETKCYLSNIS